MKRNTDWKVIAIGLSVFILVFSLFVYMGISIFNSDNEEITNEIENKAKNDHNNESEHDKQSDQHLNDVTGTDADEHPAHVYGDNLDDVFKENLSSESNTTFFDSITFSPMKVLDNITLNNTSSVLVDTNKGNILLKAKPHNLYVYNKEENEHFVIDEGVNLASFDKESGFIYYSKSFLIYEKIYFYNPNTRDKMELYQIDKFKATDLNVQNDVVSISGYKYIKNQKNEEKKYNTVFIPNFTKENIFSTKTFTLGNTSKYNEFIFDKDIFTIKFNEENNSLDIYTYPVTNTLKFNFVESIRLPNETKKLLNKETNILTTNEHYALYNKNFLIIDNSIVNINFVIKKVDFVGDKHLLILGNNFELYLYSIKNNEKVKLQNNATNFSIENNEVYIQPIINEVYHTNFTTNK